ncbi:MAG: FG-GAP repeat protein [Phycisphaerales bacterium]|nr:FG-GAP repeat protein [Phycisphaerales bacterium]
MVIVCSVVLAAGAAIWSSPQPRQEVPRAHPDLAWVELPTPPWCGDCLRLGVSAAIAGDLAILGDDGRRDGPPKAGMLITYQLANNRWQPTGAIQAPVPTIGDEFGSAIALDGDRLLVGSPGDPVGGPQGGMAWIYHLEDGQWHPESMLAPSDPHPGRGYGWSVAISDDLAAVGSPSYDHAGNWDVGRVEIFRRSSTGWYREAVLDPPLPATSTRFGWALAFTSDRQQLLIGAPGFDLPVDRAGAVFAAADLRNGNWSLDRQLQRSEPDALDRFGGAIGCTSSHAVIGIEGSDLGGQNAGAIAVARTSPNFRLVAEHAEPSQPGGRLGSRIAARNDLVAVRAGGVQPMRGGQGLIRIMRYSKGDFHAVLDLDGQPDLPPIGAAVAVDGEQVLLTAIVGEDGVPEPGRAWVIQAAGVPACISDR